MKKIKYFISPILFLFCLTLAKADDNNIIDTLKTRSEWLSYDTLIRNNHLFSDIKTYINNNFKNESSTADTSIDNFLSKRKSDISSIAVDRTKKDTLIFKYENKSAESLRFNYDGKVNDRWKGKDFSWTVLKSETHNKKPVYFLLLPPHGHSDDSKSLYHIHFKIGTESPKDIVKNEKSHTFVANDTTAEQIANLIIKIVTKPNNNAN